MKTFTGAEYLMIDVANAYGKDKLRFEERIDWTKLNLDKLEELTSTLPKKEQSMYIKGVMAIRDAQAGKPIGHLVGFDGVCSGVQMMSVLTGCYEGAKATGLVDPDRRADAYTQITDTMRKILGTQYSVSRADAKQSTMTSFYGSAKVPKDVFGEDTPELDAFYEASEQVAPGPCELLDLLIASWDPETLIHEWQMPDGYESKVRVMVDKAARITVDELDKASFTHYYELNENSEFGLSNAANVVHSVDAYVLRNVHRRCNYNKDVVIAAQNYLQQELLERSLYGQPAVSHDGKETKLDYYIEQYTRSTVADPVILPYLTFTNTAFLSQKHLEELSVMVGQMLEYQPFEVVTIHDEFRCHPNNMNHLRQQYIYILAGIADSELLSDLLTQLFGVSYQYKKVTQDLSKHILNSSYALC